MLGLLAEGRGQKEIAHDLTISSKTVGTHIQNLLAKFAVHSRAELVATAYRQGIVSALFDRRGGVEIKSGEDATRVAPLNGEAVHSG